MLKPNLSQSSHKFKHFVGIIAIIVMVGSVLWWFVYRPYSVRQDKKRFEQARHSIDMLYEDIKTQVGEPEKVEKKQYCTYVNLKLKKGPLSCTVSTYLLYQSKDDQSANAIMYRTDSVINLRAGLFVQDITSKNTLEAFGIPFEQLATDHDTKSYNDKLSKMPCYTKYSREPPYRSIFHDQNIDIQKDNLYIEITCSKETRTIYYPQANI